MTKYSTKSDKSKKTIFKSNIFKKDSKKKVNQDNKDIIDFVWLYGRILFEAQSRTGHGDGNGDDIDYLIEKWRFYKGNWKAIYSLDKHDRSQSIWYPPYHITFIHKNAKITRSMFNKLKYEIKVPENILMDDFVTVLGFTNNKWNSCVDGSLNQVACIMKPISLNQKDNNISMQYHLRGCYGFTYWTSCDAWNPIKLKRWLNLDKTNNTPNVKDYVKCELDYNIPINQISKKQDIDDFINLYANKLIMAQQLVKPKMDTFEKSVKITKGNWTVTYQPYNVLNSIHREYTDYYGITFSYCNLISDSMMCEIKNAIKVVEKLFLEDYNSLLQITNNKWMYKVNSTFKQVAGVETYLNFTKKSCGLYMRFNYLEYDTHKWIPIKLNKWLNPDNNTNEYIDMTNLYVFNLKAKPANL
jgi:hypothetical protein